MKKLKRLFLYLTTSIYLLLILFALAGVIAPWIRVELLPPLQLLPALMVAGIPLYLLFFFLLRKKKGFLSFLALVATVASIWVFSKDLNVPRRNNHADANLKVISFNVKNFNFDHHQVDSVYKLLAPIGADVICFQEFRNYEVGEDTIRALEYLSDKLGLETNIHFRPGKHYQGVALLSRYPIVAFDTLYQDPDNANNGFLATLAHPDCQFGVGIFHLNSFRFTPATKEEDKLWSRAKYLLKASWQTLPEQKLQIDKVIQKVENYPNPLILAADMNAVPHSALVQPFSQRFQDAFRKKGSGLGWTFPLTQSLGVRIDYHWVSKDLEISDFDVIKKGQSDHYPILGSYKLVPNCMD